MGYSPSPRSLNFIKALEFTLPWEVGLDPKTKQLRADGGLHYKDGGVATKWGIHQKANPDIDVANLSLDDAIEIYKERYWLRYLMDMKPVYVNLDDTHMEYALTIFDGGVNCGVEKMMFWFKKTMKTADPTEAINDLRRTYYYELAKQNPPVHGPNLKGWVNRLNDLEKMVDIIRSTRP